MNPTTYSYYQIHHKSNMTQSTWCNVYHRRRGQCCSRKARFILKVILSNAACGIGSNGDAASTWGLTHWTNVSWCKFTWWAIFIAGVGIQVEFSSTWSAASEDSLQGSEQPRHSTPPLKYPNTSRFHSSKFAVLVSREIGRYKRARWAVITHQRRIADLITVTKLPIRAISYTGIGIKFEGRGVLSAICEDGAAFLAM